MKRLLFVMIAFVFILVDVETIRRKTRKLIKIARQLMLVLRGLMHHLVSMIKMVN